MRRLLRAADGTVLVPTRAEGENGERGDALLPLTPDHPQYEEWSEWLREHPEALLTDGESSPGG